VCKLGKAVGWPNGKDKEIEKGANMSATTNKLPTSSSSEKDNKNEGPSPSSSLSADDESKIQSLLSFWFDHDEGLIKWFVPNPAIDEECRAKWEPLVLAARQGSLSSSWTQTPDGTLALLLLVDQLPRNIYRGTPAAFSSDAQGLAIALDAVAKGFDVRVSVDRQMFFYLPILHQEDLLSQIACVGLYQGMVDRAAEGTDRDLHKLLEGALGQVRKHLGIIHHFGRYPRRNEALGRTSTPEELEYLKEA
jgi:uncharacterized protein (DUF924 family)